MSVDTTKFVTLAQLGQLATKTVQAIAPTFKSLSVSGNTVSFFTSTDGTGTAAATFDFPEEIFLDQNETFLVENFAWSAATYPGSTNPNLEGKTVLVLGVKGDKQTNPTTAYSFVDLSKLIDVYTAADNSITISDYTVAVKISATAGNQIAVNADGLYVPATDISGKIDKVENATAGHIPSLTSDGGLTDSTYPVADVMFKVANATAGNIATLDANGFVVDSGHGIAADSDVQAYLATIFV